MTKYIRIRNTSDNQMIVPRIALEKLGLSTKRDSAETIGRFGSGIKYAPIAALRKNWEWWFVGQDNNGPYYMQYVVRDEDGIDCVWYDYGTELKPSSFTLGAGELSWTDPFQIIREPIANAMDGVKEFGGEWSIDFVDEIGNADEYTFDVYITSSPELVDIIHNIDLYFSSNRKALFKVGGTSLLSKETSDLRVFSQNVLIAHKENMPSIFDYEFDIVDLNEERTLKSEWDMCWKIGRVISSLSDDDLIYNVINLKREGGSTQSAADVASQAKYLKRYLERSNLLNSTDADVATAALFLLAKFKDAFKLASCIIACCSALKFSKVTVCINLLFANAVCC